jgi:glycosyltransferase involved in cell wall biosynthesis
MTPSPLLLSIAIPAFNEEQLLPQTIARTKEACDACPTFAGRYEMIVCDNNSSDRTAAVAQAMGCRVVHEPVNQISRARNRAAAAASGEWLLFIDADSWPPIGLMLEAAELVCRSDYVGCGSTIRIVDGPWWFKRAWESKNWSMRWLKWCPVGFILCRRTAFDAVGGFPLDRYIFEEAEFVRRLKHVGAARAQKFTVLHRHPYCASGRKGTKYGFGSWLKTALRLWVSYRRAIRDPAFAEKWYDARR